MNVYLIVFIALLVMVIVFNGEYQKRKTDELNAKISPHIKKCPVCKSEDLESGRLITRNTTTLIKSKNKVRATISLTCRNCGFVMLFADVKPTSPLQEAPEA